MEGYLGWDFAEILGMVLPNTFTKAMAARLEAVD